MNDFLPKKKRAGTRMRRSPSTHLRMAVLWSIGQADKFPVKFGHRADEFFLLYKACVAKHCRVATNTNQTALRARHIVHYGKLRIHKRLQTRLYCQVLQKVLMTASGSEIWTSFLLRDQSSSVLDTSPKRRQSSRDSEPFESALFY